MYNRVIKKKPIDYIFVQLFEHTLQSTAWSYIEGSRSLRVSTKTIFGKSLTRKHSIFSFFRSQSLKSIFDVFWGNRSRWVRKWPWNLSTASKVLCGTPLNLLVEDQGAPVLVTFTVFLDDAGTAWTIGRTAKKLILCFVASFFGLRVFGSKKFETIGT